MSRRNLVIILTLIFSLFLPNIGLAEQPGKLMPSEAIVLMLSQAMNKPSLERNRKSVWKTLLPRVITKDLSLDERMSLGEVYFFSFMPEEARDAYYPLLEGESLRARVAWQRVMQIRFRAFGMHERVSIDMRNFRKSFPVIPRDREYLSRQVTNFANLYASENKHEKVVSEIEAELAVMNYQGAYSSFMLPATYIKSYVATGKKQEALNHLVLARDGLSKTLDSRKKQKPENDWVYPLPADIYYFFYTPLNEKLGWQQKNDKFEILIDKLNAAIHSIH